MVVLFAVMATSPNANRGKPPKAATDPPTPVATPAPVAIYAAPAPYNDDPAARTPSALGLSK